jgi:hypothetical protein
MSFNDRHVFRSKRGRAGSIRRLATTAILTIAFTSSAAQVSRADESGVSFWLPGLFGSLAAVPVQPGFGFAAIYYHTSVSAPLGTTFQQGGGFVGGVKATADLFPLLVSYAFATPVLGGQFAISLMSPVGSMNTGVSATLTGPGGLVISGARSDSLAGSGDLYPTASLKWNQGVHNFMTYLSGDIPVGAYSRTRLSNIGLGHGAIDGGAGYTYFDKQAGHEFSAVAGLTYNFINPQKQVQSGVDFHLDWAASQFLSHQFFVGAVGYVYNQLSCDTGSGNLVGCFKSRVAGVGPQVGFLFPAGEFHGFLGLKGYKEFAAENRPSGWNTWVTVSFSPAGPPPAGSIVAKY